MFAQLHINDGARIFQDHRIGEWINDTPEKIIFKAVKITSEGKVRWYCYAPGYGNREDYGSGAIIVGDGNVELLTPVNLIDRPDSYLHSL